MLTYVGPTEKIHIRWPDPQGNCSEEVSPENGIAKRRRVCERCCPRLAGLVWTPFRPAGAQSGPLVQSPGKGPAASVQHRKLPQVGGLQSRSGEMPGEDQVCRSLCSTGQVSEHWRSEGREASQLPRGGDHVGVVCDELCSGALHAGCSYSSQAP